MHDEAIQAQQQLLSGTQRPVIFDVGGHIGQSVRQYKEAFPSARVYSFEPTPASFAKLEEVASRYSDAFPIPIALSDARKKTLLHRNENGGVNSLLPFGGERPEYERAYYADKMGEYLPPIEVATDTLDNVCRELQIESIDLLKMDTQGTETQVLKGGRDLLERQAIKLVFVEVNFLPMYDGSDLYHHVATSLEAYGYSLYNLFDLHHAPNGQIRFANGLFVSPELRASKITPR